MQVLIPLYGSIAFIVGSIIGFIAGWQASRRRGEAIARAMSESMRPKLTEREITEKYLDERARIGGYVRPLALDQIAELALMLKSKRAIDDFISKQ